MNQNQNDLDIDRKIREQLASAGFSVDGQPLPSNLGPDVGSGHDQDLELMQEDRLPKPVASSVSQPRKPKDKTVVDSRFIELTELPSNFIPYDFKSIYVRPFAVSELKLIARSIEQKSIDYITQAIDNCLDVDVYQLTIPDYFYLYYWFRIESYPSTPYYSHWVCDELLDGKPCSHNNVTPLTKNQLSVSYLEDDVLTAANLDPRLDFPRVSLLEDLSIAALDKNDPKQLSLFQSDELFLVDAAKWVKAGTTIFDKIKILEEQPDLNLYELAKLANQQYQYGVYEYTLVQCGGCGAKRRFKVMLDAPKFFPYFG